jgi:hypothetical protein
VLHGSAQSDAAVAQVLNSSTSFYCMPTEYMHILCSVKRKRKKLLLLLLYIFDLRYTQQDFNAAI